jgi:predicted nucleic acid-binding protein
VHAAVMQRHGISRILSFDSGFDRMTWMERIGIR